MTKAITWLASTIGKRGYIARYLRSSSPPGSIVIGTGNERFTPGFMSCDRAFLMPAIADSDYLETVLELCSRESVTAAVCLADLDIAVLSKARDSLQSAGVACFFPGQDVAMRFLDKAQTAQFLTKAGFDTPETFTDLAAAIDAVGFPIVVKPRNGSASKGFGVFRDRRSAEEHWTSSDTPMIAQPFVQGRLVNVEACSDDTGKLMGISAWERHVSIAGETLLAETIEHYRAVRTAQQLLEASPIPGPIDIDMIEADGKMYVLEVNTRFGGGYPTSHLAGADFTGALVGALQGRHPETIFKYRAGVTMMKEIEPVAFDASRVASAREA
ncbi:MAG TPA: ATP-grasp domain-containing protein [Thermomicrobiales bacterium]|nr:ATP-grasp domain-containing protein [Thermomicrobiales bacterium]